MRWRQWMINEGPIKLFMLLWLIANVIVFMVNWERYAAKEYAYLHDIVGYGLQFARGAANILNLNCALVLLPVCRNLVDFVRGAFESKRSIRRLFDKNITFHKWCAYMICLGTAIHVIAHIYNVNFILKTNGGYSRVGADENWAEVLFLSTPGITGVLITLSLILMVSTATDQIRTYYFELFWYTHHLFVVFYLALGLHGYSGFVEKQSNYEEHPFGCLDRQEGAALGLCNGNHTTKIPEPCPLPDSILALDDPDANCCPCWISQVETQAGGPGTWMWIIGPLFVYVLERLYRGIMCYLRPISIVKVVKHQDRSPVLELDLQKFPTRAGQYIFLHVPEVSMLEWHPFTLTSCPELDTVNLHIRICGDWTSRLAERCGMNCISFKMHDKRHWNESNVKDMLIETWPDRSITWVFKLSDGTFQHPSDDEFSDKDVAALRARDGVVSDSIDTVRGLAAHLMPRCAIDGPFGTSSADVHQFETVMLVGAGIGVTPYASILQALYFHFVSPEVAREKHSAVKKIYFYWICPGFDSWAWFANLLIDLEDKLTERGLQDLLCIRIFMTRGWTEDDAAKLMVQDNQEGDLIVMNEATGQRLHSKMNSGRPMWDKEFGDVKAAHPGQDIGVFFCGIKTLSSLLHKKCNEYSDSEAGDRRTRFFYHKENF